MFSYYFLRSSWNQLRTFVRTWAFLLFAALFTAGSVAWRMFLWYYHRLALANPDLPADFKEFFTVTDLTGLEFVELAFGLFVLGILVIQAIAAEKSVSNLFTQADVNMLFSSDRSPQSVLAFRVTNTLGLAILAAVYLAIRLPSLVREFHITPWGGFALLLGWCLTFTFSALLKIIIYELGSKHPFFHRNLRWFIFAALGIVGIIFYRRFDASAEREVFLTANEFFNSPITRLIPIWGWIKGTVMFALEGNVTMSLAMASMCLGLIAILAIAARNLPADYYEETLSRAQENAMLNEAAFSDNATLLVTRTRHGRRAAHEGFNHGFGASVYFFRVLHHRFRSARFGFITKTMITYTVAALGTGLYVRYFLTEPYDYLHVLVLAGMVFFRTIVSPVTEDIRMAAFLMQPEPVWSKLFFSLLGGSVNCALDSALALMIGSWAAGFSPFGGLLYLPVLVGVDFFASASGAFTDVSIPTSIGVSFKQVIQIILLYAGLIFDGVILVYGVNSGHSVLGFGLVTALNCLFGGAFLGLTGVWLYPNGGLAAESEGYAPDNAAAKGRYTRVGIALTCMFLGIHVGQHLLADKGGIIGVYLPIYCIGFPLFLIIIRLLCKPEPAPVNRPLTVGQFLLLIPVCFFVMYLGNIVGSLLQGAVYFFLPCPIFPWRTADLSSEYPVIQALLLAVAAPVMEEFVFRRTVIRQLLPFGEKAALVASALMFALFHSAVNQACYAFLLGLVFGYVYIKTGRLRYSMALHVIINAMTSILLPALMRFAMRTAYGQSPDDVPLSAVITKPGVIALLAYVTALLVLSLLGSVLFFYGVRQRDLSGDSIRLRTAFSAWGVILFTVLACTVLL